MMVALLIYEYAVGVRSSRAIERHTAEQIIVAAEISTESLDTANLHPMLTAAEEELHAAGVGEALGVILADAGYWKNSAIEALAAQGLQPLVARTPIAKSRGRDVAA